MDKEALKETAKEIFRIALFAAISAVIAVVLERLGGIKDTTGAIAIITTVLRAIDKYVHEADNIKANGISPI